MIHLVQIGVLGHIGRFTAADGRRRQPGCAVICRTRRGLEAGTVLKALEPESPFAVPGDDACDGQLVRRVTPDDRLILKRIERFRDRAFEACTELIRQHRLPAVLMDAEQLFDGQTLYFYFLGEVTDDLNRLTDELAETWEARVRFRQFTERLSQGCGPDCGTGAAGCGTRGCSTCSLQSGCRTGSPSNGR